MSPDCISSGLASSCPLGLRLASYLPFSLSLFIIQMSHPYLSENSLVLATSSLPPTHWEGLGGQGHLTVSIPCPFYLSTLDLDKEQASEQGEAC